VQQCLRLREECPAGFGETAALRGAVEQPHTQLVLQTLDLATERRLGEVQGGRATPACLN
jgi:hypothetical protein